VITESYCSDGQLSTTEDHAMEVGGMSERTVACSQKHGGGQELSDGRKKRANVVRRTLTWPLNYSTTGLAESKHPEKTSPLVGTGERTGGAREKRGGPLRMLMMEKNARLSANSKREKKKRLGCLRLKHCRG